jgi:hypothetical protein
MKNNQTNQQRLVTETYSIFNTHYEKLYDFKCFLECSVQVQLSSLMSIVSSNLKTDLISKYQEGNDIFDSLIEFSHAHRKMHKALVNELKTLDYHKGEILNSIHDDLEDGFIYVTKDIAAGGYDEDRD